jgi:RNA polymerase sigma factor (sigma-70 family)
MSHPDSAWQNTVQQTRATLLAKLAPDHPAREDAWKQFLELYVPAMRRYARSRHANADQAEEVVAIVVAAFCARIEAGWAYEPGTQPGRFRAFLRTATVRATSRLHEKQKGAVSLIADADVPTHDASALEALSAEEERALFEEALARVKATANPAHVQAWEMQTLHGVPPAQVAQELSASIDAVHQHRSRINRMLREQVERLRQEADALDRPAQARA